MKVGASILLPDIPQPSALKAALLSLMAANETIFFTELPDHRACQAVLFCFSISDDSLSMKNNLGHSVVQFFCFFCSGLA